MGENGIVDSSSDSRLLDMGGEGDLHLNLTTVWSYTIRITKSARRHSRNHASNRPLDRYGDSLHLFM